MNTGFDVEALESELASISDIDMSEYGFDIEKELGGGTGEVEEDDFDEEPPEEPTSKLGDIYKLGESRLMCGDSTNPEHVAKLMDGHKARMIFTSPPYSDMREYNGEKDLSVSNLAKFIDTYKGYCDFQCVNLGLQYKDKEIYPYWDGYIKEAHDDGLKLLAWNVWDKLDVGSIGMQKHMFPVRHEWIFVFGADEEQTNRTWEKKTNRDYLKVTKRRQPDGSTTYSTVGDTSSKYKKMESVCSIMLEKGKIRAEHPATFPIQLPAEYIKSLTDSDDGVIEPFCGSGSTLIACEQLGRKCYGMELDPRYMDVIIKRWEEHTGKKAVKIA
jgi:DNA modification methylase